MRQVIVALVSVGGLLIATPAVFEGAKMYLSVRALSERSDLSNLSVDFSLPTAYWFGCWVTGSALAAAGINLAYRTLDARPGELTSHSHAG